jgi:cation diffusion facilitator family transporter
MTEVTAHIVEMGRAQERTFASCFRHLSRAMTNRNAVPENASSKVVYAAILANVGIAAIKLIAGLKTGSSAMMAEAYHSAADTGNEILLLLGMHRSRRSPDRLHPFGHGKVLYFYSLLVAVFIFVVGGALAAREGIQRWQKPELPQDIGWNYAVLALAVCCELYSWRVSRKELLKRKSPEDTLWQVVLRSKDPTVFTVFMEDSAALLGLAVAGLGILLGQVFKNPYFDAGASLLIALLLGTVAIILGRESGALLVGESAHPRILNNIRAVIVADPFVDDVGDLLTMQLGPDQVLLAVDIRFKAGLQLQDLENTIDRLERNIRKREPTIERIFIEADALRGKTPRAA